GERVEEMVEVGVADGIELQVATGGGKHEEIVDAIVAGVYLAGGSHRFDEHHEAAPEISAYRQLQIEVGALNGIGYRLMKALYQRLVLILMFAPYALQADSVIKRLQQRHHAENVGGVGRQI